MYLDQVSVFVRDDDKQFSAVGLYTSHPVVAHGSHYTLTVIPVTVTERGRGEIGRERAELMKLNVKCS